MFSLDESIAAWVLLTARTLLALVFLVSGIHKLVWHQKAIDEFKQEGIPLVPFTLPATIILHLLGSACLILGIYVQEAALSLAVFTVIATIKVQCFWTMQGEQRLDVSRMALANLGIVGGLLLLVVVAADGLP
jgi:uncharacterized membrane protein YphA (DoxX/SURF4 family)